ncbi:MAG: hypothetical protein LUD68_02380 [Rikenellaceae bacterium]|nr:hypothetical protein [Rikenellaceae bacterium]
MLKRYPIRVVKYFLSLVVLFIVLFGIMLAANWSSWEMLSTVWKTDRLWVLLLVFIGIPLAYPFFGYTARGVRGNLTDKREVIERVLAMSGYHITESYPDKIVAHARGIKKVFLRFEDRIEISAEGNHFVRVDGPRREVVKIESRIRAFMNT